MTLRRSVAIFGAALIYSAVGSVRVASAQERHVTENFAVSAPTKALAKTFGEYAEKYRKEKAVEWLGHEIKNWPNRCPLSVSIRPNQNGGETSFTFGSSPGSGKRVLSQEMLIFGEVNQLLTSVLPHEVTHTIFAHHFGEAVPRWADEGGSVYSENDEECYQHDVRCRVLLNKGYGIPLRVLFSMTKYPSDMHTLYAQGYSVVNFLVEKSGRRRFLDFVRLGMQQKNTNWEQAVLEVYDYKSVDDLEDDWIQSLRRSVPQRLARGTKPTTPSTPGTPATVAATPTRPAPAGTLVGSRGIETRTSSGGLALLESPVVARGVSPAAEKPAPAGVQPPSVLPLPAPLKLGAPQMPPRR